MKNFKRILIVRTDRMGDVILTTPSIRALRKAYPKAHIAILVAPATREFVEGNPYVDEILIDDRKNEHSKVVGFFKLAGVLRQKKFDCAIIFHTKKRTNALCFFAGIPYRVGYRNDKFGFFITDPIVDRRHEGERHEVEYCLDVLRHMGIEDDGFDINIPFDKDAEDWADKFFKEQGLGEDKYVIAIHPGSSDQLRTWPKEGFIELIRQMTKRYSCRILLVGDKNLQGLAWDIHAAVKTPLVDLIGKTTISQFVSVLRRCSLVVSTDSGPVHVAAGLKTPVISIFTRNIPGVNPKRWRPLGEDSKVVMLLNPSYEKLIYPKELQLLHIQEVLQAVDQIFKLC